MASVLANGSRLQYDHLGAGDDLVLVHGFGANRAFWRLTVVPRLARHFRVLTYDLRGHGLSDMPRRGYTSRHMADDLAGLLEALEVPRADVVGHSFGGAVALHLAARQPGRVRRLVLADARVPAFERPMRLEEWPHWAAWSRQIREAGGPVPDGRRLIDHRLLRDLARPEWRPASRVLAGQGIFLPGGSGGRHSTSRILDRLVEQTSAARDAPRVAGLDRAVIASVGVPVLAVYGELSHCLRSLAGLRSTLPDCTTLVLPGVGHFFPAVQPARFTDEVCRFLGVAP